MLKQLLGALFLSTISVTDLERIGSPHGSWILNHSPAASLDVEADLHVGEKTGLKMATG
jgi:hypothetical protein